MVFANVFDTVSSLGLPRELIVIAISILPILELRGALPIAINILHLPWQYALLLAILRDYFPAPKQDRHPETVVQLA